MLTKKEVHLLELKCAHATFNEQRYNTVKTTREQVFEQNSIGYETFCTHPLSKTSSKLGPRRPPPTRRAKTKADNGEMGAERTHDGGKA